MKNFVITALSLSLMLFLLTAPARASVVYDVFVDENGTGYYTSDGLSQQALAYTTSGSALIEGTLFTGGLVYTLPSFLDASGGAVRIVEGSIVSDFVYFTNNGQGVGASLAFFSFGGGSNAADQWIPAGLPQPISSSDVTEGDVYTPLASGLPGGARQEVHYHFLSDSGGDVPEPGAMASVLSGLGLLGFGVLRRAR